MSAASTSAVLRHIPSEILDEILLNLPVKSLLRFSTVSKSWLSMISESRFVREQNRRAAVNGVGRMVTLPLYEHLDSDNISVCRIPHTSSTVMDDSTRLICPIEGDLRHLHASCDGLWLVEAEDDVETEKSLYLWNPSTRVHRKLPDSPLPATGTEFVYGLGYDSLMDDYNVLKIGRETPSELYSMNRDLWKTITPPPPGIERKGRCEYVNGSFHWIPTSSNTNTIVSFNSSTEKCGEILFPVVLDSGNGYRRVEVEVVVVRGKLCVTFFNDSMSNPNGFCFVLLVMEEYAVEKSWTKMLNIEYNFLEAFYYPYGRLSLVHFYDNGDVLFNASYVGLCMYKNEEAQFQKIWGRGERTKRGGFTYVESLISP